MGRKLSPQAIGPYTIKKCVGNLAYELELPESTKIHPVVSVSQLEPHPSKDPFGRTAHEEPRPVDGDDLYMVETLLRKRKNRATGKTQYLIKWQGWGPAHNAWYNEEDLGSAKELIREFEERGADQPQVPPYRQTLRLNARAGSSNETRNENSHATRSRRGARM